MRLSKGLGILAQSLIKQSAFSGTLEASGIVQNINQLFNKIFGIDLSGTNKYESPGSSRSPEEPYISYKGWEVMEDQSDFFVLSAEVNPKQVSASSIFSPVRVPSEDYIISLAIKEPYRYNPETEEYLFVKIPQEKLGKVLIVDSSNTTNAAVRGPAMSVRITVVLKGYVEDPNVSPENFKEIPIDNTMWKQFTSSLIALLESHVSNKQSIAWVNFIKGSEDKLEETNIPYKEKGALADRVPAGVGTLEFWILPIPEESRDQYVEAPKSKFRTKDLF